MVSAAITLRALHYALAVIETGSLGAAGKALAKGSSTLSIQLSALEAALATQLFVRGAGGLTPTAAGRHFEQIVRPLLDALRDSLARVRAGTLRVPEALAVGLRDASPGCLAWDAQRAASGELARRLPFLSLHALPLLPFTPDIDNGLILESASDGLWRDRWIIAGHASAGERVAVPSMAMPLARLAEEVCGILGLQAQPLALTTDRLDDLPRPLRQPILIPRMVLPGWLRDHRITLTELPAGPLDPRWALRRVGGDDARHAEAHRIISDAMCRVMKAGLRTAPAVIRPPEIEHEHLACFEAALRHMSLTGAAAELRITQPAATLRLQRLEAWLRQRLFERHPHGLTPGIAAQMLAAPARAAIQEIGRIKATLAALREPAGQIRVGVVPALDDSSLLAEAVALSTTAWSRRFPRLRLRLVEHRDDELRRLVLTSALDLAIIDNDVQQPGLSIRSITREPMVAVTRAGSGLYPSGEVRLRDLPAVPLALTARPHGLRSIIDLGAARIGLDLRPTAEIDSFAVTMRLVKQGGWATILPMGAVRRGLELGELQANPIVEPALERCLSVVRRHGQTLDEGALAFVDLLATHLQGLAGA